MFQDTALLKIERGTMRGSKALLAGIQNARAVPGNKQAGVHQEDRALQCGVHGQHDGGSRAQRNRRHQHVLAVVDIRDMSGDRDEGQLRYELHQPDQSKIQRRARALVHFPSHGNLQHLQAENKDQIADEITPIRGDAERRVGVMSRFRGRRGLSRTSLGVFRVPSS